MSSQPPPPREMPMSPSRLRQRLNALYRQLGQQIEVVLDRRPLFAASLYEHTIKCGKPQCQCAKSKTYRHHMWCVSFTDQGRSKTRVVPQAHWTAVQDLTEAYRRVRDARRQIQRLTQQLKDAAHTLAQAQCQQGDQRYMRLAAKAPSARVEPP
jgi:hypothetical protein